MNGLIYLGHLLRKARTGTSLGPGLMALGSRQTHFLYSGHGPSAAQHDVTHTVDFRVREKLPLTGKDQYSGCSVLPCT